MAALRIVTVRAFATLWVAVLGFLALAQPAHTLLGSPVAALVAQGFGACALAGLFAFRGAIRRQLDRGIAFIRRSHGLRAVVRAVAVGALAAPAAGASEPKESEPGAATQQRLDPQWSQHEASAPNSVGPTATATPGVNEPTLGARP